MSVFTDAERLAENDLAFVVADKYPMTRGHMLVCPKREIAHWFDATEEERKAIMDLASLAWGSLDVMHHPSGYRIMINDGTAQHIPHVHVHVIPHYSDNPNDWRNP